MSITEIKPSASALLKRRIDMRRVAPIVLAGGVGTRLFPLTLSRCKPALPFAGNNRLIDIPVSHALAAGCEKVYVLTQFLSASLHHHLLKTYSSIQLLTAEQKPSKSIWYQGTADAVRQNLEYLAECDVDYFLILSGDQLYQMDFEKLVAFAEQKDADLLIASLPVKEQSAVRMGILKADQEGRICDFYEKPSLKSDLDRFRMHSDCYLGSMGIYLFKKKILIDLLNEDSREDFGKHLIPSQVTKGNAFTYQFPGYWEDIGTVRSFYEANIALTKRESAFDLYLNKGSLKKAPSLLPPPKIDHSTLDAVLLCEGAYIDSCSLSKSIIGPLTEIEKGTRVEASYLFGNTKISQDCMIERAIIDKNVRLGNGVKLLNKKGLETYDGDQIYIRDGIIVVARGAYLPDGFTL